MWCVDVDTNLRHPSPHCREATTRLPITISVLLLIRAELVSPYSRLRGHGRHARPARGHPQRRLRARRQWREGHRHDTHDDRRSEHHGWSNSQRFRDLGDALLSRRQRWQQCVRNGHHGYHRRGGAGGQPLGQQRTSRCESHSQSVECHLRSIRHPDHHHELERLHAHEYGRRVEQPRGEQRYALELGSSARPRTTAPPGLPPDGVTVIATRALLEAPISSTAWYAKARRVSAAPPLGTSVTLAASRHSSYPANPRSGVFTFTCKDDLSQRPHGSDRWRISRRALASARRDDLVDVVLERQAIPLGHDVALPAGVNQRVRQVYPP